MSKNNIGYDKDYIESSIDSYINEIKLKERSIKLKKILKNGTKKS